MVYFFPYPLSFRFYPKGQPAAHSRNRDVKITVSYHGQSDMLIMAPAIELIGTTFVDHAWGIGGGNGNGRKGSLNAGDPIITPAKEMIEQIPTVWRLLTLVFVTLW